MGLPNPYRLRPFLGARVPLNFSFSTTINMHNPYETPLQVSGLTGLVGQECLHNYYYYYTLVLSNYLFQSKQACEAFTTVIITAPVCHVNIKKSNSISFSSFLSCFASSVLLDYFRNMGWKCVQVLVFFFGNQRLFGCTHVKVAGEIIRE